MASFFRRSRSSTARIALCFLFLSIIYIKLAYDVAENEKRNRALMHAITYNDEKTVDTLLSQGADPNAFVATTQPTVWKHLTLDEVFRSFFPGRKVSSSATQNAIQFAIQKGNAHIVKSLLDRGANPNVKIKGSQTALMWVAYDTFYPDITRYLLDKGADVNAKDLRGYSALADASLSGHARIVKCLIERNADVNITTDEGETPLILAAAEANAETINLLLAKGADVNIQSNDGTTVLMNACMFSNIDIVKALIAKGANVNTKNHSGETALKTAIYYHNFDVARLLKKYGAGE